MAKTKTTKKSTHGIVGTPEQEKIWDVIAKEKSNVMIYALAGTGKTFTVLHASNLVKTDSILCLAFNASVRDEWENRQKTKTYPCPPPTSAVLTTHQYGYRLYRNFVKKAYIPRDKNAKVFDACDKALHEFGLKHYGRGDRWLLIKGTSAVKSAGIRHNDPDFLQKTKEVLVHKNIVPSEHSKLVESEIPEFIRFIVNDNVKDETRVSFDDMLYLPYTLGMVPRDRFDIAFVDEAQDFNVVQHHLALQSAFRLVVVGDPNQSIYAFRGADHLSMENFETALGATKRGVVSLPLNECRRCCTEVIRVAQTLVPDIRAMKTAPAGQVVVVDQFPQELSQGPDDAFGLQLGDMIVCRINAPLVSNLYSLWKKQIPATMIGNDIADELIDLIDSFDLSPDDSMFKLSQYIEDYRDMRREKILVDFKGDHDRAGSALQALEDRVNCLTGFIDHLMTESVGKEPPTVSQVKALIKQVLMAHGGDPERCIRFSSIHRAKGLEARRVWIIETGALFSKYAKTDADIIQERNAAYVAITRAKEQLFLVGSPSEQAYRTIYAPANLA